MTTEGTRGRLIAGLAVAALALGGCSGGGKPEGGEGIATIVDNLLAAKVPGDIKGDGVIRVAADSTRTPNAFLAADGRTVTGLDVDLFDAVAEKLGLRAEYVPTKPTDVLPSVTAGTYEVGVSAIPITTDGKKAANLVSYYRSGTRLATQRGNPARLRADDLCGRKIAVVTGTPQATTDLPARQKRCTEASRPEIVIKSYRTQAEATTAVVTGRDDALVAGAAVVAYEARNAQDRLEALGEMYDAVPCGLAVGKAKPEFAQTLVDAIKALIAEGTYGRILAKWGVQDGAIATPAVNP